MQWMLYPWNMRARTSSASALSTVATVITGTTAVHAADADAGAPFGMLPLVDEVDLAAPDAMHPLTQDPPDASRVEAVLGRPARVLPMSDDAAVVAVKIGAGKGLVAGQAYVLEVELPDDVGRQTVIVNRGADQIRTYASGPTIGDSRASYVYPSPESLRYPQSQQWKSVRTLFWLHERFQGIKGARGGNERVVEGGPADGFWVAVGHFRKKDSPLDAGAAVGKVRLFAVQAPEQYRLQPFPLPSDLPKRHVFWREEMSDSAADASDTSAFADPMRWWDAKMKTAAFLGVNTFGKDLLEFGYNQGWDSEPHGGNDWVYQSSNPKLWEQLLDHASANQLDVMPYYEYAGAIGGGSAGIPSYGVQRHCRPLGDRPNDHFSDVSWSENACIDVSDPAALEDAKKLLDDTIVRWSARASIVGAWFRTRSTNWPISFADEALGRYAAQRGVATPTRSQLKQDPAALDEYYAWWFEQRRTFLIALRDHLRERTGRTPALLFTSYIEEALRVPEYSDVVTPTDDVPTWQSVNATDPWKYQFPPASFDEYVSQGKFLEMTTRMRKPTSEMLQNASAEPDHSAPPADPQRYRDVDDVYLTMPFSRLFTVSAPAAMDAFRAKSGLAMVRHFCLNEEDGQNAESQAGPMSKKLGYFVTDVDRIGAYSMLAEARALAHGDPRLIGYLASGSFNRGFPEYTRAFHAAYLALPALPSTVVPGAASDPEVVVRAIATEAHGTYYAVVNTSLVDKSSVRVTLGAPGVATDLVAKVEVPLIDAAYTRSFYPGEVAALNVQPGGLGAPAPADAGGSSAGGGASSGAGEPGAGPHEEDGGCGCHSGSPAPVGAWLTGLALGVLSFARRGARRGR